MKYLTIRLALLTACLLLGGSLSPRRRTQRDLLHHRRRRPDAGLLRRSGCRDPEHRRPGQGRHAVPLCLCHDGQLQRQPLGDHVRLAQPHERAVRPPASLPQVRLVPRRGQPGAAPRAGQRRLPHRAHRQVPRGPGRSLSLRNLPQGQRTQRRADGGTVPGVPGGPIRRASLFPVLCHLRPAPQRRHRRQFAAGSETGPVRQQAQSRRVSGDPGSVLRPGQGPGSRFLARHARDASRTGAVLPSLFADRPGPGPAGRNPQGGQRCTTRR